SARLELSSRQRLAFFGTSRDEAEIEAAQLDSGFRINGDRIILAQPVMLGGKQEGTLSVLADLRATTSQLVKLYGSIFVLVLIASLLVAFILSGQFLRFLTDPILRLTETARTIDNHSDYSVRASKTCNDEVGVLTDAFNQMLDHIQSQDTELRDSQAKLAQAQSIAHLGYWERDLDVDRIRWSDETYRIFGLQPQERVINFEGFASLVHPQDLELVKQTIASALNGGPRYDMGYRIVRPDGEVRFVHSQADIVNDNSGRPRRFFGTAQDVTDQKRAEQALVEAEHKYREIFENAVEGIFQSTSEGKFLSVNPALARMFGYDSPEDLIAGVGDIQQTLYVDPKRRDEFKQAIETHGSVEFFEYEIFRKDHGRRWLCENSRVVRDSDGKVSYYEGTVEDITERRRVEEVERASKAKSEFLSRMSHELRTPLNAILGFGQLMERQSPTPVQKERIAHILNAGRHLLNLINEILDISRVESGRFQLSLEPVLIEQAVDEAIDLIRPTASARNIEIERFGLLDGSPSILADRQRLKQVLLNLLSNAVKYNRPNGRVVVDLVPQNEGRLRISVSDEGPGIPPDKRARLFSPFDRLGAENTITEGTGLGLALSKRLTEAMGGNIGEGGPAMGACFWIEFPMVKSVQEQAAAERRAPLELAPMSGDEKTILYIEDNLSNLSLIEQLLKECAPIKLISAMQGQLGIELATRHQPDLILLDVHLPDINGPDVLARLKSKDRTRDIPVVVLSADATKSQINRLTTLGASDYLTKPLDVDCFLKVIEHHFCPPTGVRDKGV
ncbi:MAG TPA: PAS domain-containing protein, partial [Chthoniobacterales bacterium]|nr:PAS domain-containing protein [Chthoniobacterales bacterium]